MDAESLVMFIENLPAGCIEKRDQEKIIFHLPRSEAICPRCGSSRTCVDKYRTQILRGIKTDYTYIYKKRRYKCNDCKSTFNEKNPFIGESQHRADSALKRIRGNRGIKFDEMAKRLGLPIWLYREMEGNGVTAPIPPPTMEVAEKIAEILSSSIREIWGDGEKLQKKIDAARQKREELVQQAEKKEDVRRDFLKIKERLTHLPLEEREKILSFWMRDITFHISVTSPTDL